MAIRQTPSSLKPSPSEVIDQREIGQIDTPAMMEFLLSSDYGADGYDPTGGDGFVRGHWRQIEDALVLGLITDEEYEWVARAKGGAKRARAAH